MTERTRADVAVLGAAGQTGRPLVRALSNRGAKVRAVVQRSTGNTDADAYRLGTTLE